MVAPRTVLVVDDSPTALRMTSDALVQAGYHVLTAADGDEALVRAESDHPDVIILDIILPKRNGYEVCRQLKLRRRSSARILLLSSKSHAEDRAWGLKQGADGYLTKPFNVAELQAFVDTLAATTASCREGDPS